MSLTRRDLLKLGGSAAALTAVPGWMPDPGRERARISWAARTAADMPEPDVAALLLDRAAYGARPGEVESARAMGAGAWLDEQLDDNALDDSTLDQLLANELPTLAMTPQELMVFDKTGQIVQQLHLATLYRMAFRQRQLHEVMVQFWSDHFSMSHQTANVNRLKTIDDAEVVRPHALGNFVDLLTASARSPAMMVYLDNEVNTRQRPNENYAREIMELHTTGVAVAGYPYTEEDVKEVARCLTGWTWWRGRQAGDNLGLFRYDDRVHDQGAKEVLGEYVPANLGEQDGYRVIDLLVNHEATPLYLATKLVRRFVTDDPAGETPDLVDRVAKAFARTSGDIKAMVREVFMSAEFAASFAAYGGKMSRPQGLVVRAMRALDASAKDFEQLRAYVLGTRGLLAIMGHVPFYWATPDGYPDVKEAWTASGVMLGRWNYGLMVAGATEGRRRPNVNPAAQTPPALTKAGQVVDYWIDRTIHRPMLDADRALLVDYLTGGGTDDETLTPAMRERLPELIALVLDSPYFQWR